MQKRKEEKSKGFSSEGKRSPFLLLRKGKKRMKKTHISSRGRRKSFSDGKGKGGGKNGSIQFGSRGEDKKGPLHSLNHADKRGEESAWTGEKVNATWRKEKGGGIGGEGKFRAISSSRRPSRGHALLYFEKKGARKKTENSRGNHEEKQEGGNVYLLLLRKERTPRKKREDSHATSS